MIYSLEQIAEYIEPVAEKYGIPAVYVFGSYARGEAEDNSDIDLLVEIRGSTIKGLLIGGLYNELEDRLPISFDLITMGALNEEGCNGIKARLPKMEKQIRKDMVKIYGQ
jgi:predicted nucleotidyltransferase